MLLWKKLAHKRWRDLLHYDEDWSSYAKSQEAHFACKFWVVSRAFFSHPSVLKRVSVGVRQVTQFSQLLKVYKQH